MRARYIGFLSACGIALLQVAQPEPLHAQARLEWPSVTIDVSQYTTVEQCYAAVGRVQDSVTAQTRIWLDTMPVSAAAVLGDVDSAVTWTARRCARRFSAKVTSTSHWYFLFRVYLDAGWYEAADTLLRDRLAALDGKRDSATEWQRAEILDSAIEEYVDARPVRFTAFESRARELVAITNSSLWTVSGALFDVFQTAEQAESIPLARWSAEQFSLVAQRLTPEHQRQRGPYSIFVHQYQRMLDYLAWNALRDSLRISTAAYATLKQVNWKQASQRTRMVVPVGTLAPRIEADFWYGPHAAGDTGFTVETAALPRPNSGSPSLIVFLSAICRNDGPVRIREQGVDCSDTYAILRRFAARFPGLDITIISKTQGYYWYLPPLDPAEESQWLARWWQGFHHIPATLAVTNTPFWRLADPDRRRIDRQTANESAYSFGTESAPTNKTALLTDKEGAIVHSSRLSLEDETRWNDLIDILMRR